MTPATLPIQPEVHPEAFPASRPAATPARAAAERGSVRQASASPGRYARVLIIALLLGCTFRNYWTYSHYEHLDPSVWMSFVNGTGAAPEQYRVGVKVVAWWIMRHVGGGFRHSFALLDFIGSVTAGMLLYSLLERTRFYRRAGTVQRWLSAGVFLVLLFYYLSWLPWFEKAETLPSAGLVAGLLWMWSRRDGAAVSGEPHLRQTGLARGVTAVALLLLTTAQALVRADIALLLAAGMFAVALTRRFGNGLAMPRTWALSTSAACAVLAAATQVYMMRVAYPSASYRDTPVFMLRHDFAEPLVVGPFALFLLPVAWTAVAAFRRLWAAKNSNGERLTGENAAGLGLLVGALLYLPLWMALGKLDEVRIFLPFALALSPFSAELVAARVRAVCEAENSVAQEFVEGLADRHAR